MNALGLGMGIRLGGGNVPAPNANSSQVQQFLDRLVTPPDSTTETNYATLIDGLVAAGLWDKLDCLFLYCVPFESYAVTNLKNATYQGYRFFYSSGAVMDFTANVGFSAASQLVGVSSGFNPATASGANFARNSGSAFVFIHTATGSPANGLAIRGWDGAAVQDNVSLYPSWNGQYIGGSMNEPNTQSYLTGSGLSPVGLTAMNRVNSTNQTVWRDGVELNIGATGAVNSAALVSAEIWNSQDWPTRAFGLGSGLTTQNHEDLYDLLSAFITAQAGTFP